MYMLGKKDKRVCKTSQSWKRSLHWGIQAEFFLPDAISLNHKAFYQIFFSFVSLGSISLCR